MSPTLHVPYRTYSVLVPYSQTALISSSCRAGRAGAVCMHPSHHLILLCRIPAPHLPLLTRLHVLSFPLGTPGRITRRSNQGTAPVVPRTSFSAHSSPHSLVFSVTIYQLSNSYYCQRGRTAYAREGQQKK